MLIDLQHVSFGFDDEDILKDICLTINENERLGFIGQNGAGKTTLLKIITGEYSSYKGNIVKKNNLKIGYLEQNSTFESDNTVYVEMRSVFEEVLNAIEKLAVIEKELSTVEFESVEYKSLSQKYENLRKYIDAKDGYQVDVKVKTILNGMGFEKMYDQQINTMSGGEKTRLKLCKLLLEEPELLILDEPTNHLDIKTLFWLEDYLNSFKGSILIVSHDRYFLDRLVGKIIELENKNLHLYKGNYSKYKILKAEKVALWEKEYDKQQEEIAKLEDYIARNIVRATTAKSAQSRVKKLENMELIEKPYKPETPPVFKFEYDTEPYENVLKIENLNLKAGEKELLKKVDLLIKRGERVAICGDNGTGKSSLIKKFISSENDDNITLGRFVKVAYYDQENANLNKDNTLLYEFWSRFRTFDQTQARKRLARVKLTEEDIDKKVGNLSGGERAKLALAIFEAEKGNFLILDEPTNHLDLLSREALENSLKEFSGTLLFVSHDRYFIDRLASKIIYLKDNSITIFEGSYSKYIESTKNQQSKPNQPVKSEKIQNSYYRSKEERALEVQKKQKIKAIEKEIAQKEEFEQTILNDMALPENSTNYKKIKELTLTLEKTRTELDELYLEYEKYI